MKLGMINELLVGRIMQYQDILGFADEEIIELSGAIGEVVAAVLDMDEDEGREIAETATRYNEFDGETSNNYSTDGGYAKQVDLDNNVDKRPKGKINNLQVGLLNAAATGVLGIKLPKEFKLATSAIKLGANGLYYYSPEGRKKLIGNIDDVRNFIRKLPEIHKSKIDESLANGEYVPD